jgi:hypothetical protein
MAPTVAHITIANTIGSSHRAQADSSRRVGTEHEPVHTAASATSTRCRKRHTAHARRWELDAREASDWGVRLFPYQTHHSSARADCWFRWLAYLLVYFLFLVMLFNSALNNALESLAFQSQLLWPQGRLAAFWDFCSLFLGLT